MTYEKPEVLAQNTEDGSFVAACGCEETGRTCGCL